MKLAILGLIEFLKSFLMATFGYLIYWASFVEPSPIIWVVSIAGALTTIIMGHDRNIFNFFGHFGLGVGIGIFGSQIIHNYINVSQVPLSYITSLFAVEFFLFIQRNFRSSNIIDLISIILNRKKSSEK